MMRIVKIISLLTCTGVMVQGWRGSPDQNDFYQTLRRYKAAVILLYDSSCMTDQTKKMKKIVAQIVSSGFYPKKALIFISLDIAKSDAKTFMQDYELKIDKFPALILFVDGQPIQDQHGIVQFKKSIARGAIKSFIDTYLHLDLAQCAQEERVFKRYKNIIRDRAHVYYMPYFSKVANPWNDWWGWPYYGMAQGNYGGNIGVNFFASNY